MSDEIKTNEIVDEVVENDVPETEEVKDLDNAEDVTEDVTEETLQPEEVAEESADDADSKKKKKKDLVFKINPKTGKKQMRG